MISETTRKLVSNTAFDPVSLQARYQRVRDMSTAIAEPLSDEDCALQSMPDASPIRWHLAHTTWFFETFLLKQMPGYRRFDDRFEYLFNSYYNAIGQQFPRHQRGQISRPNRVETARYRNYVDEQMHRLLEAPLASEVGEVLELGLNHEQQHQELMWTDIKHALSRNPLYPAYRNPDDPNSASRTAQQSMEAASALTWEAVEARLAEVGSGEDVFKFDNEAPRHKTYLHSHAIASRCVTNGEYLEFVNDRAYARPELWLSLGWNQIQQDVWQAPLYWQQAAGQWHEFTLEGLRPLRLSEPVCHVSYFEAEAYARWRGYRLPTEFEWECCAATKPIQGVFADGLLKTHRPVHPQCEPPTKVCVGNLFGNVWEWTASQYLPYPGYKAAAGAIGEYNGKFMCNQFVLRGGSCATSQDHIRASYRNFFPPDARWQFSGIRLAK